MHPNVRRVYFENRKLFIMKNIKFILALFALGYSLSGIAQRDIVIIDKANGAERAVFKKEPRLNDNTKVVKF